MSTYEIFMYTHHLFFLVIDNPSTYITQTWIPNYSFRQSLSACNLQESNYIACNFYPNNRYALPILLHVLQQIIQLLFFPFKYDLQWKKYKSSLTPCICPLILIRKQFHVHFVHIYVHTHTHTPCLVSKKFSTKITHVPPSWIFRYTYHLFFS